MSDPHYNRPPNHQLSSLQISDDEDDEHRVVETDPSGRFERYVKCLGKGAYKDVFKGFDTEEGMEVAWNQLRVDHLQKREAQRILGEIQILQSLRNDHIINLYHSWIAKGRDGKEKVYFITELMMSGTLKNYIRKTKGAVKPKVLRNWCRQILSGLDYLHTRQPPIIHRDLKCDNIFINGNNGQAKIGDLGLAVVRHRDHVSSVLGTPEFMAPELYDENYNEKVDIYAFGMMVLEIATKEYPYSECTNQAQIYKKVSSGIKPAALSKIADDETRQFIDHCIQFNPRQRPTAGELLRHPFLLAIQQSASSLYGAEGSQRGDNIHMNHHRGSLTSETRDSVASTASSIDTPTTGDNAVKTTWYADRGAHSDQQPGVSEPVRVDAENHTFEILSRIPPTPSVPHSPYLHPSTNSINMPPVPPTTLCSVEIVQRLNDTQVLVKMIYGTTNRPAQEIKFPFHYAEDTADAVVDEMVKEGIIDGLDQGLASERLESAVRGSERGSYERSSSREKFPGYPTAVLSPPGSPATFPRYRNLAEIGNIRSVTMPRQGGQWPNGPDYPDAGRSRDPSPLLAARTMPRPSASPSPHGPRAHFDAIGALESAPFALPPAHGQEAAPTVVISSIASVLSSSAPASISTTSSRPSTPTPIAERNLGGQRLDSLPTRPGATGIPALRVESHGVALPHGEHWVLGDHGIVSAAIAPVPAVRTDPELQRRLMELQELNLAGFSTASPRNGPSGSEVSPSSGRSATSQASSSLGSMQGGSHSSSNNVASHFVTLGQMQQQGVGVGQTGARSRNLPLSAANVPSTRVPSISAPKQYYAQNPVGLPTRPMEHGRPSSDAQDPAHMRAAPAAVAPSTSNCDVSVGSLAPCVTVCTTASASSSASSSSLNRGSSALNLMD
ncbi:Serine/threonine-protein kinase wnk3 [Thoreauomyces humboldtii]|nr:Serine/threonine-protein kinase wnk3 [Thoreauomyces humboldtii]